jgi:dienelactone hydrolase
MDKLQVTKTAKIACYGDTTSAQCAWIVLHGYGQLAQYFIRKFSGLDEAEHLVIAPEGLHRFYLNGTAGRVGASWMTKEERLDDIEDNLNYLDAVYSTYIANANYEQVVLVGFSQGASTAARWLELRRPERITTFIQWAGVFPPDLQPLHSEPMKNIRHVVVLGNQDPYFSAEKHELLPNPRLPFGEYETVIFDGAHDIHTETLLNLASIICSK